MIISWGRTPDTILKGDLPCEQCGKTTLHKLGVSMSHFGLFFVPLIYFRKKFYLQCLVCELGAILPQQVAFDLMKQSGAVSSSRIAPTSDRAGAFVLDLFVIWILQIVVGSIAAAINVSWWFLVYLSFPILVLLYHVISYYRWGKTMGETFLYLKVVWIKDPKRQGLPFGIACVRTVVALIGYVAAMLGSIWMLLNTQRRGWHDLAANTIVVQDHLGRFEVDKVEALPTLPRRPWIALVLFGLAVAIFVNIFRGK